MYFVNVYKNMFLMYTKNLDMNKNMYKNNVSYVQDKCTRFMKKVDMRTYIIKLC